MTGQQERVLEACRRVQSFMDANATLVDSINKSATRKELDTVTAELSDSAGVQATGQITATGESANQRILRLALRDHMQRIAAVAALRLKDVPQFASLTMPSSHASVRSLIAHATAMGNAAQVYQETFLDAGLQPDFIATLGAAAMALAASRDVRANARGKRSNATGALKQASTRARHVLKALNPIVVHALSADSANAGLLAEWKAARHVSAKLGPVTGSLQAAASLAAQPAAVPPITVPASPPIAPATSPVHVATAAPPVAAA